MPLLLSLLLFLPAAGRDVTWDPELQLTDSAYDQYTDWSTQKSIAVGRDGRIHVVWTVEDYFLPVPFQVFYKRYNPGTGWTEDTCISADEMALGRFSRYPSVVVDTLGRVHVVWMIGDSTTVKNCVVYKRCTPEGTGNGGWQTGVTWISGYSTTELKFTPDIAASPDGHVHVVWARQSGASNGIHYRESTDGGSNWQTETALFDTLASGADQITPSVATARNNTVHVAWCGHPYFGEAFHLYYKKRIGTTWFARENIVTSSAHQYVPSIACSPLTNNPHILWRRWYASNNYQIVYSYWDNTWQPVISISDPSADTSQCSPQLCFTPDGAAHAVWRGYTSGSPSLLQIRYAARSSAGVWAAPIDLTSAGIRTRDYPSIAGRNHDLCTVWQDDRGTYQNLWLRHGTLPFADVACRILLAPTGTVDSGMVITPACSVYNYDTTSATYTVRLRIGAGYNQTATVTGHAGGTAQYVEFPAWTVGARGSCQVRCSTELATDYDRANDRQTDSITVQVHDVGVFQLLAPTGNVDSGSAVIPSAEVRNYGTNPETFEVSYTISDGYSQTITRTVAAGADSMYDFPTWTALTTGSFVTRCSTGLTNDARRSNDASSGTVTVGVHDVGVVAIVAPTDTVDSNAMVAPRAVIHNWGTGTESFSFRLTISDGYAQTIFRSIAAHAESTFQFPDWRPAGRGLLAVRCSTMLAGDSRPENDTASGSVLVVVRDIAVTGILAPTDTVDSGTVVYPRAVVRNLGTGPGTLEVAFLIGGTYAESAAQFLAAGEIDTLEFNPWTASPVGLLAMECIALPDSDMNPANDTARGTVFVRPLTGIEAAAVAERFGLTASPNLFRTSVTFRASGPPSRLAIYDANGALVREYAEPGSQAVVWNGSDRTGRDTGAGVFYARLTAGRQVSTLRLVRTH